MVETLVGKRKYWFSLITFFYIEWIYVSQNKTSSLNSPTSKETSIILILAEYLSKYLLPMQILREALTSGLVTYTI